MYSNHLTDLPRPNSSTSRVWKGQDQHLPVNGCDHKNSAHFEIVSQRSNSQAYCSNDPHLYDALAMPKRLQEALGMSTQQHGADRRSDQKCTLCGTPCSGWSRISVFHSNHDNGQMNSQANISLIDAPCQRHVEVQCKSYHPTTGGVGLSS